MLSSNKISFLLFLLLACGVEAGAQLQGIQVSRSFSTEELVRDVFLKSGCKNVSNIQAIDNGLSIGFFEDDAFIFGFQSGIIITSGDALLAEGPNAELESTHAYAMQSDDPDLNQFAPGSIFDVGGIEFDFVPVGKTVSFEYAFASEEYCEFVDTEFNDVFGFFVSGPGINGPFSNNAANVALVPGTNDFVAINSVNYGTNPGYYIKNELFEETDECDIPFAPVYPEYIEYDGMTVQLTATINVIPCETYHIRLLVADVGDDILDSGVFLGAKTFDLNGDVEIAVQSEGSDQPVAVEGCRNGEFVFQRLGNAPVGELVVYFNIGSSSTATAGSDYTPLPDSIIIPAGQSSAILTVEVLEDLLNEPDETLVLEIRYPCDCIDPVSAVLTLQDHEPLEAQPATLEACVGQPFTMQPGAINGLGPYSYLWPNGSTHPSQEVAIQSDTTFSVTITDVCNDSVVVDIAVGIQPLPEAIIEGSTDYCEGPDHFLEIHLGGHPPWAFQYTIDGNVAGTITGITNTPYLLPVSGPGVYGLGIFTDANCTGLASGSVSVQEVDTQIETEVTPASCFDNADGAISWSLRNGQEPVEIHWTPPLPNGLNPEGLLPGTYDLLVTDSAGCQYASSIMVPVTEGADPDCRPFDLFIPNSFSPNNDGINDDFRLYPSENSHIEMVKSIRIFNRWGGLVFEQSNFEPSANSPLWDGTFKGKTLDAGIYVWQVVLVLSNNEEHLLAGDVTLIR